MSDFIEAAHTDLYSPVSFGGGGDGNGRKGRNSNPRRDPHGRYHERTKNGYDLNGNGTVIDEATAVIGIGGSVASGGMLGAIGAVAGVVGMATNVERAPSPGPRGRNKTR